MNDFKRLADQLRSISTAQVFLLDNQYAAIRNAIDILTTLANVSADEPDEKPDMTGYGYDHVKKANRDHWRNKCMRLSIDNENLKTVMIAAAEEIQKYWPAHCDAEGYGPANLMRRLEMGIPSEYGYKAGDFERIRKENEQLKQQLSAKDGALFAYQKIISKLQAGIDAALSATVASPEDKHVTTLESIVTQAITQQGEV